MEKRKYFSDFEFKNTLNDIYWFPIFLNATNGEEAFKIANLMQKSLAEHYEVTRFSKPTIVIENLNTDIINNYIKQKSKGKLAILDINVWKFKEFKPNTELTFDKNISLLLLGDKNYPLTTNTIAEVIENKRIPVRRIINKSLSDFKDYFIVNILKS